jgi:uncharacterized protein (TIGR03546 family)
MLFRKIGALIRGRVTPFQIMAACVLGAVIGFLPGWAQAPGLMALATLLLIILNANLLVAGLVGLGARLLSLAAAPVLFKLGRVLLDGPTSGLFERMINAPVLALFGFEYYVTTGGLLAGVVVGVIVGALAVALITAYRRKMVDLEKNSERFKQYSSKRWVKFLTWVLVGGGPGKKVTYEQLLTKRIGNPIRTVGAIFAVLVVVLVFLLQGFLRGPIVTAAAQSGLERVNGATVDLGAVDLDLKAGKLTMTQLAMADPNRLDTDLFRAATIEADVSAGSLLRKRLQLDRVVIRDASSGEQRAIPGTRVGPSPKEPEVETPVEGTKTLDDYLKDAAVWKERLAQARRWLEKLSGPADETAPSPETPEGTTARTETLEERLRRQVEELGYHRVKAEHRIQKSPTFTVTELVAEQIRVAQLPQETLTIAGRNLSTHPAILNETPELNITSSANTLGFSTRLGQFGASPTNNTLAVHYHGLPTDDVAGQLKVAGGQPVSGGTIDLDAQGSWTTAGGVSVNLPLQATLHQVTLAMQGMQPTKVEQLTIPIGIEGPLDRPRIRVDDKGLANALAKAGVQRAKDELQSKAEAELKKQAGDQIGEQGGQLLRGILGGQKKQ